MPHDTPLITTIVAALVLAFFFGAIANRLRLPPLIGYLLAGVVVGPYTPGLIIDQALAPQLAEIGVILLMFGVGLHFSLGDLLSVRAVAIPGALVQIAGATALGWGLAALLGWPWQGGLVFGLSLSVASTVVLLKALQDRRLTESDRGRIATGWLIVEDFAMVLALVLIPALAGLSAEAAHMPPDPFVQFVERLLGHPAGLWLVLAVTIVKLAAFVGFMLVVGRRIIPLILHLTAHTGSRELFRLAVLAIALGMAAGAAYLFGVSLALGAFFAGMILSESELSQRAAEETLPLRDAFAVLFFVSVGMLVKPQIFVEAPFAVVGTLAIIVVGKALLALAITLMFRRPVGTALTIAASLAQIGEFSFILIGLGMTLGLVPAMAQDLIVAGAIVSIVVNPVLFFIAERLRPAVEAHVQARRPVTADLGPQIHAEPSFEPQAAQAAPTPAEEVEPVISRINKRHHIILVGFGRVGAVVAEGLAESGGDFVVIEDAEKRVAAARERGMTVLPGNAADAEVLKLANVEAAETLMVAIPNTFEAGQATEQARRLNGRLRIIVRSHSDGEDDYLTALGADAVVTGEREIAMGMLALARGIRSPEAPAADDRLAATGNVVRAGMAEQRARAEAAPDPMHEVGVDAGAATPDVFRPAVSREAYAEAEPERVLNPALMRLLAPPEPDAPRPEVPAAAEPGAREPAAADEAEPPTAPARSAEGVIVLPDESGPDESALKDVSPRAGQQVR